MNWKRNTKPKATKARDTAAGAAGGAGKRRRFGIAARLYMAFGVVVLLTLLAGGISLNSGRTIQATFTAAVERSVPEMSEALHLQADAAALTAAAPQLAAAPNDSARLMQVAALEAMLMQLEMRIERLEELGANEENLEAIRFAVKDLSGATQQLDKAVQQRLQLATLNEAKRRAVEQAHGELLEEAKLQVRAAGSDVSMRAVSAGFTVSDSIASLLSGEVASLRTALEGLVTVQRLGSLLLQASTANAIADVAEARDAFTKTLPELEASLDKLSQDEIRMEATQSLGLFGALGVEKGNIFDERVNLLLGSNVASEVVEAKLSKMRDQTRAIIEVFENLLMPVVESSNTALLTDSQDAVNANQAAIQELMDDGVGALEGLLRLEAEANRMAGLLGQAMTAPDQEALSALEEDFGLSSSRARAAMIKLASDNSLGELRTALEALGEEDGGVFALRAQQLAAEQAATAALVESRAATESLGTEVMAVVLGAEGDLAKRTDAVGEAFARSEVVQAAISVASLLISLLIAWLYVGRNLVARLKRLAASMRQIAGGDLSAEIPAGGRDEVAEMAQALSVFRDGLAAAEAERQSNERDRQEATARRRQDMLDLAEGFESSVKGVVDAVSTSASEMQSTAEAMSTTAEHASNRAQAVSAASEETSGNVQAAAAAARQLADSISEIGRQVTHSNDIAQQASSRARDTNTQVEGLSAAAQKIGEVVKLIQEIAEQTNLLALNATIEAARAGEAGRGFAVVASEVKNLANQTAKATEEIGAQIGGMQAATEDAVSAIQSIGQVIEQMSEIATSISAAVEEQGAATDEIASTMARTADSTQLVVGNIGGVTEAASETGAASGQVLVAAGELSRQSETLRSEVERFLQNVRAA
jgi:methyl-accepting chemotaxis protein